MLGISLVFPQITNEHYKVCVIEQLRTSMNATSLPSSTVD